MIPIQNYALAAFLISACLQLTAGEHEILANQQTAETRHLPQSDKKEGWGAYCVSRGGTKIFSSVTREYNMAGDQIAGSSFFNSSSHAGTVAAVPIGDFESLEEFSYKTSSGVQTGRLISVAVQISAGNGTPAEMVMQRAVENLIKSGVPLPPASGAKPGRLLPVLDTAKKRYGARIAKVRYDAPSGHVLILLLDCKPEKADETYLPATLQGYTQKQRAEMAKALKRGTDQGGLSIHSRETEIIPEGSRRIPFNGAPHTIIQ